VPKSAAMPGWLAFLPVAVFAPRSGTYAVINILIDNRTGWVVAVAGFPIEIDVALFAFWTITERDASNDTTTAITKTGKIFTKNLLISDFGDDNERGS
jgi:hypothetical protein